MNSEKVKNIKKALEFQRDGLMYLENNCAEIVYCKDILTYINELESENKELKKYRCDWLNSEKMHLQADMEDTEFELASSNRILEKVSKENQTLKDRIIELEKEKSKLEIELDKRDCIDYPCRLIEKRELKQFAEMLKEKVKNFCGTEYENAYYDVTKSFACNEIDETLKEFLSTTV